MEGQNWCFLHDAAEMSPYNEMVSHKRTFVCCLWVLETDINTHMNNEQGSHDQINLVGLGYCRRFWS